jgi:hypothetical protein
MPTRQQRLSGEQINIRREVDYIVGRAAERDARIVTLGPLVFFSTESGDAWLLDPSEQLALCLARDGDPQAVNILESTGSFAIDWEMTYQVSGNRFIVTDREGQSRTTSGYPIRQIAHAIQPEPAQQARAPRPKLLGRNELCWCGSGKKYKQCHMSTDHSADGNG